ncbi:hypothetical protein [Yersinia ruckeri]|uniref:hypothetical protein n=1 Tax=Yersinia ruckeri TaxID=29486 RepID=UPI002236F92C|nr:hypothetical protein [Yersinia ruckeri]MCW6598853.1 hypothetical protein [Yersinia ruckeri]
MESDKIGFDNRMARYAKEGTDILNHFYGLSDTKRNEFLKSIESTDSQLMKLPHPVTSAGTNFSELSMLLQFEVMGYSIIREDIRRRVPMVNLEQDLKHFYPKQYNGFRNDESCMNMGGLQVALFPVYYKHANGALITVRPGTISDLVETDLGKSIPSEFFCAPFQMSYIHLDDANNSLTNQVFNNESGSHKLSGMYVLETHMQDLSSPDPRTHEKTKFLGLDKSKPCRVLDIMFVGHPKAHVSDDATYSITLYIQDSQEYTMGEIIERHIQHYMKDNQEPVNVDASKFIPLGDREAMNFADNLDLLAKVLLFINCERELGRKFEQKSNLKEFDKKIAGLGPKKRAKEERKRKYMYDTLVIGSNNSTIHEAKVSNARGEGNAQHRKVHWRRGHFRNQKYGVGNSKSKVIRIEAALINKKSLLGENDTPVKKYTV